MKYFIDTEFIEDGHTIDLISIGVVSDDGREYYAQSSEFVPMRASIWVKVNVLNLLSICQNNAIAGESNDSAKFLTRELGVHPDGQCVGPNVCPWRSHAQIKAEILAFMNPLEYGVPELWGYYSAYDHVVFCQLFGTMMELPIGFPMYTNDLKQWSEMLGNPEIPEQENSKHNALSDAKWNKIFWYHLNAMK